MLLSTATDTIQSVPINVVKFDTEAWFTVVCCLFQEVSVPSRLRKPTALYRSGLWRSAALTALAVMVR